MKIKLSPTTDTPVYQQIVQQVQLQIATGRLRFGDELPSIRALASQLLINPNTVARAYRDLELMGAVYKRGTTGTFVADQAGTVSERKRMEALRQHVDRLLITAKELGFSANEVIEVLREGTSSSATTARKR